MRWCGVSSLCPLYRRDSHQKVNQRFSKIVSSDWNCLILFDFPVFQGLNEALICLFHQGFYICYVIMEICDLFEVSAELCSSIYASVRRIQYIVYASCGDCP